MAAPADHALDPGAPNKWLIALALMLGTFMEVLDTSVANVALPHMKGTYSASTDEITWVLTSYLVANAIILPITGWLGNTFGQKRLYLTCLALFTMASLAAGAAPTLPFLILARVIQGLAGGAMVPMSQAMTMDAFPRSEQGIATAVFGIGVICGPIVGPLVGGWITDNWSWPWIFWINIPVGILAWVLASTFVEPRNDRHPAGRMDYWSLLFIAVGLGFLEVFLNRGERLDWFQSNAVKAFAGLAALGLVLFLWRSLTAKQPLVDLRMFKLPEYASGMFLIFGASFGMYAAFVLLPLFAQTMLGFTPTWAGVMLSPGGIASVVAMMAAGLLLGRIDVRWIVAAGFIAQIYSSWLLTAISLDSGMGYLTVAWCFRGLGLGFVFVPVATAAMRRIAPESYGVASGIFNLMRNEGGSVGIACATTLLQTRSQFHQARLTEHITAFNGLLQQGVVRLDHLLFATAGQDPASVRRLAMGLVGAEVSRQAYLMAFVDVFFMVVIVYVICLPFVILLKDPGAGAKGMAVH
jgi:DHA2 family multidrug resistance protein